MAKVGKIIFVTLFIILLTVVIIAGIIGLDIYFSYKAASENTDQFKAKVENYSITEDNSSINIVTNISSPKLGFIPKGLNLMVEVIHNTDVIEEIEKRIDVGTSQLINLIIELPTNLQEDLENELLLTFNLAISITPVIFGFPIDRATTSFEKEVIVDPTL